MAGKEDIYVDKLEQAVTAILDTLPGYDLQEDGMYACEVYADYRDEMDNRTAIGILQSEDPEWAFWEQLDDWYRDQIQELESGLEDAVKDRLLTGPYKDGMSDGDYDRIQDVLMELACHTPTTAGSSPSGKKPRSLPPGTSSWRC